MALSAFDDPAAPPTPEALAATLGPASPWWAALVEEVRATAGEVTERWAFSGPKNGWSMRVLRGDRVIAYLTPRAGSILVGVVLGEKAIAAATAAGTVSTRTLDVVAAAPRYAEGRGVRIAVETGDDLAVAKDLARIKLGR
jgi:hypothetical protein